MLSNNLGCKIVIWLTPTKLYSIDFILRTIVLNLSYVINSL